MLEIVSKISSFETAIVVSHVSIKVTLRLPGLS